MTSGPRELLTDTTEVECRPPRELRFRAMGSDAHVIVSGDLVDGRDPVRVARDRVEELESRWSRFRSTSEVSELSRRAGEWVAVSTDTELLARRSVEAWRLTGSSYDPTVLGDILRAGYDRTYDEVASAPAAGTSELWLGCADIEIREGAVRLPFGVGFDAGGIGKGLAADLVAEELMALGAAGVCINLGGDLRVIGVAPDRAWVIGLELGAGTDELLGTLSLAAGGVATSTTLRRHWEIEGESRHHLIDPATGQPSDSDLVSVSVVAGTAWVAEVLAKALLLRGSKHAFDLIGGTGVEAISVDRDGVVRTSAGFARFAEVER
jgi:thiamine biosynthesis lipoprotein